MSLLTLTSVTKRFGALTAVDAVSLAVAPGTLTAVVGPSGSGKTTMLRLIAGFERPDAGEIHFAGEMLANGPTFVPAHRRGIGLVAQEGALFPHLTAAENIAFGIDDRASRSAAVDALFRAVDLDPAMGTKRPHELSGGQQQRVALARALARKPKLMLFDEPFSALDAGLRSHMREMVKSRLAAEGVTGILVTHDQQEALSFADQLVVLDHGAVVQAGSPRELYLQPRTEVLASFLGDALFLDGEVREGAAETPLGRVRVGRTTRDGRARIMLRPEQVRLVPWSEGATRAQIQSASFEGPITVVNFRAGDANFTLKCPSADAPVPGTAGITIIGTGHAF